jgi:DNA-binding FadR family transcriptional regulator
MLTPMPPPFPGTRRYPNSGLHGQIVHMLGSQIVSGSLVPGHVLAIDSALGASRTVMREVVKVLATKGLVESRPRTGTRVLPREAWNLLDPDVLAWRRLTPSHRDFLEKLTELRLVVEPAAASLAARRAGEQELETIAAAFERMEAALALEPADFEAFDAADMDFHRAIVQSCGNELLEQMAKVVLSALHLSFQATSRIPGRARESIPNHRAILDAIRRRQAKRAERAMRRLVETTGETIATLPEPG